MRLVFHSNAPWNNSGYGKMAALIVPRLIALGHEVIFSAPYSFGGAPVEWNSITVMPSARDQAGNDTIVYNHEYFKADWTITLADPFGLLKSAKSGDLRQINLAHWFPVDTDPLGDGDVAVLREGGGVPVAFSRFGERVLADEGAAPLYCPLAVDTSMYSPGDPAPYRDSIPGVTDATFVVGLCAMNRDLNRKAFFEQMLAFSMFHARHPDSILAIHSSKTNNPGLNLEAMATRLGIANAVAWPDGYSYDLGLISEEQMAWWYRGLDVLSLCSYAEGFGLPLVEAQACGIPAVTTDGSAMTELCGAGWLVSGTPFWASGHNAMWVRPDAPDIGTAYETAWRAREDGSLAGLKKVARDFALTYDIDHVFGKYMVPVLGELEKLADPAKAMAG